MKRNTHLSIQTKQQRDISVEVIIDGWTAVGTKVAPGKNHQRLKMYGQSVFLNLQHEMCGLWVFHYSFYAVLTKHFGKTTPN